MNGQEQWRGFVNAVLYLVQFEPDLERALADDTGVQRLIDRPLFDRPVQDTVDALRDALTSGGQLTGGIPQPHDERAVRSFLTQLVDRLEQSRPWPLPPYRMLSIHDRPELLDAPVVGTLSLDWKQAADRLRRTSQNVGTDAVMVLQLRTGETVAIVDDLDQRHAGTRDGRSTLTSTTDRPSAEIVEAFRAATGFTDREAVAVDRQIRPSEHDRAMSEHPVDADQARAAAVALLRDVPPLPGELVPIGEPERHEWCWIVHWTTRAVADGTSTEPPPPGTGPVLVDATTGAAQHLGSQPIELEIEAAFRRRR